MFKKISVFAFSIILMDQVLSVGYISGINTTKRPENAPTITKVVRNSDWYNQTLHGLSEPYPRSFEFIYSQGNWSTPFNKPGMLSPYDIRGWHR